MRRHNESQMHRGHAVNVMREREKLVVESEVPAERGRVWALLLCRAPHNTPPNNTM